MRATLITSIASTTTLFSVLTTAASGGQSTVIGFENGWEGWNGLSGSQIVPDGGNPGAHVMEDDFYFSMFYWTDTNQAFLGDYTQYSSVTLSIDVKVNEVSTFGTPQDRELFLELSNFSIAPVEFVSAWIKLGDLPGTGSDWTTYSITFDPNNLSDDWQGSDSGLPGLPDGTTLADIMAGVEEARFTTTEPGFNYTTHYFNAQVDNIRIDATPIPAPAALPMLIGGLGLVSRRRRAS